MKDLTETLPVRDGYQPSGNSYWLEVGVIVGAALLIVIAGMIWAKYFRNTGRRRHSRTTTIMGANTGGAGKERHRERYSRRNPTLAETGGLPPIREDLDAPSRPPAGPLPS
jgi:hypothetical protein